jgi:hypothetical protein
MAKYARRRTQRRTQRSARKTRVRRARRGTKKRGGAIFTTGGSTMFSL